MHPWGSIEAIRPLTTTAAAFLPSAFAVTTGGGTARQAPSLTCPGHGLSSILLLLTVVVVFFPPFPFPFLASSFSSEVVALSTAKAMTAFGPGITLVRGGPPSPLLTYPASIVGKLTTA